MAKNISRSDSKEHNVGDLVFDAIYGLGCIKKISQFSCGMNIYSVDWANSPHHQASYFETYITHLKENLERRMKKNEQSQSR